MVGKQEGEYDYDWLDIDEGHYATASELIQAIQGAISTLPHARDKFRFIIRPNKSLSIKFTDKNYLLIFNPILIRMLGLNSYYHDNWLRMPGTVFPGGDIQINAGASFLMIYSDVGEMVRLIDRSARILRCISSTGAGGSLGITDQDTIAMHFPNIYYVPVARARFDNISIAIHNDIGELVHFTRGKTLVVLHFRRRHRL